MTLPDLLHATINGLAVLATVSAMLALCMWRAG